jgi:SAM-dependent methyltransferase
VLEYGCGTGSAAFDLAARDVEVLGIDISPEAVAAARRTAQERGLDLASFEVMNAEALTLPEASMDAVCGSGILHHLDLDRSLAEVRRVLRPGGFAVFLEPLGTNPVINLYRRLTPSMRTPDEHPLVPADFDMMRARFGSVEVEHHNLVSLAGAGLVRVGAGERTIARLHRMDDWLFRRSRLARRMAWVALIVLRP